jgi:hypothetical protein
MKSADPLSALSSAANVWPASSLRPETTTWAPARAKAGAADAGQGTSDENDLVAHGGLSSIAPGHRTIVVGLTGVALKAPWQAAI